jgi:hypothetical protein
LLGDLFHLLTDAGLCYHTGMMTSARRLLFTAFCFAGLLPVLLAGSGCARIAATSEVRADGSMTRTVTYNGTSPDPQNTTTADGQTSSSAEISMSPHLEDLVVFPNAAGGWKVTRTRDQKSNVTVTASRVVAPGQTVRNDLGIRLPKPKPAEGTMAAPAKPPVRTARVVAPSALLVENTATIRTISPGRLEYREVLHWRGPRPKEMDTPDPQMVAALRRSLPTSLSGDAASLKQVGIALQRELWTVMFGPGDPILPLIAFHQDLAEYRIQRKLRGAIRRSLSTVYGARLSADALNTAVDKLTIEVANDATRKTQAKKEAGPGAMSAEADGDNPPIALMIRVKLPGKVTETNGELDPETNEVVWPLYSEAAAIGDITLTATTDVSPPK